MKQSRTDIAAVAELESIRLDEGEIHAFLDSRVWLAIKQRLCFCLNDLYQQLTQPGLPSDEVMQILANIRGIDIFFMQMPALLNGAQVFAAKRNEAPTEPDGERREADVRAQHAEDVIATILREEGR